MDIMDLDVDKDLGLEQYLKLQLYRGSEKLDWGKNSSPGIPPSSYQNAMEYSL